MESHELKASGFPTKQFFIRMLTRDIELNDAILDLLDNCLDGVMRTKNAPPTEEDTTYYEGFWAKIEINENSFCITDNCGGIPFDIAIKYAFRMGRPEENGNSADLPTIGMYGIGMKRAIFKIGSEAKVYSKTGEKSFSVSIPEDWISKGDDDWDFPIEEVETDLTDYGTQVIIGKIVPEVAGLWRKETIDSFLKSLIETIRYHYSFIIEKGFTITVNEENVRPNPVKLLLSEEEFEDGRRLAPYLFQAVFDGVEVKIALGFYAPIISLDEIDQENEQRRSSENAGWTIVCNDRVVLYNNKDYLTGWGEAGVPRYHTQFINIRGMVVFRSNNPMKLPVTTTKRGIDLSSPIYAEVKNRMREGLKIFTNYTNKWKGLTEQEKVISGASKKIDAVALLKPYNEIEEKLNVQFTARNGTYYSKPKLPEPSDKKKYRFIRFSKPTEEIDQVAFYLYKEHRPELNPSEIGERCFDKVFEEARRSKE